MRALILFASDHHDEDQIAGWIYRGMWNSDVATDLYDVARQKASEIAIDAYDAVAFGSSLHNGKLDPRISWCITEHCELLREMPTAMFCMIPGLYDMSEDSRRLQINHADAALQELNFKPGLNRFFASRPAAQTGWLSRWVASRTRRGEAGDFDWTNRGNGFDSAEVKEFVDRFVSFIHSCKRPKNRNTLSAIIYREYSVASPN